MWQQFNLQQSLFSLSLYKIVPQFIFQYNQIQVSEDTLFDISLFYYLEGIGFILAILIFFTTSKSKLPNYSPILALVGFAVACYWVYLTSNVLMDMLQLVGLLSGLNPTFLGLTFLAWGNSLAGLLVLTHFLLISIDYFNDVAMAKMGFGVMAITGCFAGQLFNLLIGFGAFLLNYLSRHDTITIDLFNFNDIKENYLTIFIIFMNLINLIQNLLYLMKYKWKYQGGWKNYMMVTYVVFFVLATLLAVFQRVGMFWWKTPN